MTHKAMESQNPEQHTVKTYMHQFKKVEDGWLDENNVFWTEDEIDQYFAENPTLENSETKLL